MTDDAIRPNIVEEIVAWYVTRPLSACLITTELPTRSEYEAAQTLAELELVPPALLERVKFVEALPRSEAEKLIRNDAESCDAVVQFRDAVRRMKTRRAAIAEKLDGMPAEEGAT